MADVDTTIVDLAISNPAEPNQALHVVQATITAVSPTTGTATIQYGSASSVAGIPYLNGIPAVNDKVLMLEVGGVQCIIGTISNPAGTGQTGMISFTRSDTAPNGWAFCNGGAINAAYTGLITLCGSNTPDLRNKFVVGAGSSYTLASTGGASTSTALIAHTHTHNAHYHGPPLKAYMTDNSGGTTNNAAHYIVDNNDAGQGLYSTASKDGGAYSTRTADATTTEASAGSGSSFSILNPYFALNPIIRAF